MQNTIATTFNLHLSILDDILSKWEYNVNFNFSMLTLSAFCLCKFITEKQ